MNAKKAWLDALKKTIEEEPRIQREDSEKPTAATAQKLQKPREAEREVGGEVVGLSAARALRSEDERRLLAAGWSPKERSGLVIWRKPGGSWYGEEVAVLLLARDKGPP